METLSPTSALICRATQEASGIRPDAAQVPPHSPAHPVVKKPFSLGGLSYLWDGRSACSFVPFHAPGSLHSADQLGTCSTVSMRFGARLALPLAALACG